MTRPLRVLAGVASRWARASQERAVANARTAAVECSRAALERADVVLFLDALPDPAAHAAAR